jgi:hypothetical protein
MLGPVNLCDSGFHLSLYLFHQESNVSLGPQASGVRMSTPRLLVLDLRASTPQAIERL